MEGREVVAKRLCPVRSGSIAVDSSSRAESADLDNITTFTLKVYLKHLKQSFRGEILRASYSAPPNCIVGVPLDFLGDVRYVEVPYLAGGAFRGNLWR